MVLGKNTAYSLNWFSGFNLFRGTQGYAFVYFCVGGIADDIKNKLKFLNRIWVNIVIMLFSMLGPFSVGVALSHITDELLDIVWYGYDTIFTFVNVFCVFTLCSNYKGKENIFRKAIQLISSNTLGVFFVHVLFDQIFKPYARAFPLISNIPGNILYSLVILIISLAAVLILKKIPLVKKLVM